MRANCQPVAVGSSDAQSTLSGKSNSVEADSADASGIFRFPFLQKRDDAFVEILTLCAQHLIAVFHGDGRIQALRIDGVIECLLGQAQAQAWRAACP